MFFLHNLAEFAGGGWERSIRQIPQRNPSHALRFMGPASPVQLNAPHLWILCFAVAMTLSPSAAHGALAFPIRSGFVVDAAQTPGGRAKRVAHDRLQGESHASST